MQRSQALTEQVAVTVGITVCSHKWIRQGQHAGEWSISILITVEQDGATRLRRARRLGPGQQLRRKTGGGHSSSGAHTSSFKEIPTVQHGGNYNKDRVIGKSGHRKSKGKTGS